MGFIIMSEESSNLIPLKFTPPQQFEPKPQKVNKYAPRHSQETKGKVTKVQSDQQYLLRFNKENNDVKIDTLVIIPSRYARSHLHKKSENIDYLTTKDLYDINSHIDTQKTMNTFLNTIESNKKNLMYDLDVTEDEYYRLANIAMGIAEQETHFGDSTFVSPIDEERTQKRLIAKGLMSIVSSDCSQGLTQIKYKANFKEGSRNKQLGNKYGITSAKDYRDNTSKCAIATMIILAGHLRTAESEKWQTRLKENNAKIEDPKEKITTDDIIALLWNGTGVLEERFDNPKDIVKISDKNTAPEWKIQLHLAPKDGMSYPRYVKYYRENMFGGKIK